MNQSVCQEVLRFSCKHARSADSKPVGEGMILINRDPRLAAMAQCNLSVRYICAP